MYAVLQGTIEGPEEDVRRIVNAAYDAVKELGGDRRGQLLMREDGRGMFRVNEGVNAEAVRKKLKDVLTVSQRPFELYVLRM